MAYLYNSTGVHNVERVTAKIKRTADPASTTEPWLEISFSSALPSGLDESATVIVHGLSPVYASVLCDAINMAASAGENARAAA